MWSATVKSSSENNCWSLIFEIDLWILNLYFLFFRFTTQFVLRREHTCEDDARVVPHIRVEPEIRQLRAMSDGWKKTIYCLKITANLSTVEFHLGYTYLTADELEWLVQRMYKIWYLRIHPSTSIGMPNLFACVNVNNQMSLLPLALCLRLFILILLISINIS